MLRLKCTGNAALSGSAFTNKIYVEERTKMDFSKVFNGKSLTQAEFEAAIKAENIKLADLSTGEYVAKGKLTEQIDKTKELKDTIDSLEKEIGELKKTDPAKLQETIDDLQDKLKKRTEADEQAKKAKALADRFSAVSGEKKFVNDFTKSGVLSEFKEALENKDNEGKSDKEIFEGLIKDREGIFSSSNPPADMSGTEPIDSDKATETLRAAMGLPPEKD